MTIQTIDTFHVVFFQAMDNPVIRSTAVEIFAQLCEVRPSSVREYVLQMSKTQQDDVSVVIYKILPCLFH
jgi:hypothetical protein